MKRWRSSINSSDFEKGLFQIPKKPKLDISDSDCLITAVIVEDTHKESEEDTFKKKVLAAYKPPLGSVNLLRIGFEKSTNNIDLDALQRYKKLIDTTSSPYWNHSENAELNQSGFSKLFDTSLLLSSKPKPKEPDMGNLLAKFPWNRKASSNVEILESYRAALQPVDDFKLVPYDESFAASNDDLSLSILEIPFPQTSGIKKEIEVQPIPVNESITKKGLDNSVLNEIDLTRIEQKFNLRHRADELARLSATSLTLEKNRLKHEIELEEQRRNRIGVEHLVLDIPKERDSFPPLPPEAQTLINSAWNSSLPDDDVFVDTGAVKITRKDLRTLYGLDWLNDEVINFYLNLVALRSKADTDLPKVYAFQTFFYTTLCSKGYAGVKRWTRKVDVFDYNIWIVPVHLSHHWCMAIVDLENQSIEYYDSLLGNNRQVFDLLSNYLSAEMKDKKKQELLTDQWKKTRRTDIPTQQNGSDCGMFACKFAEYASRRAEIDFDQNKMPYFRKRMCYEICQQKLL